MKNSCKAILSVFLLALFANAQEVLPPPSDSSLVVAPAPVPTPAPEHPPIIRYSPPMVECPAMAPLPMPVAKEEDYQKNLRVSAYLHPFSLFWGAAYDMFMFTSTVEVPLSLSNSVIIQPTVWLGSSDGYIDDLVEYEKLRRVGTGIGMRHYAADKGQGFYLQALAGLYYFSAESISEKESEDEYRDFLEITTWTKVKGWVGELIFYVGASHKWQNISLFYEGGLGFGYDGTDTYQMGYTNRLVANFNLGIGLPF